MIPCPINSSRIGNSKARSVISATASAATPFSSRAPIRILLTSLAFAELLAKEMKAQGLNYARQYSQPIMGRYQHPLLNKETGVYSYDQLIVLRQTRMAAVLLESGPSIINRDGKNSRWPPTNTATSSAAVWPRP